MLLFDESSECWVESDTGEIIDVVEVRGDKLENNTDKPIKVVIEVPPDGKVKAAKKGHRLKKTTELFTMVFIQPDIEQLLLNGELSENEKAFMFTFLHFISFGSSQIMPPDELGQPQRLTMKRAGQIMGWKHRETVKKVVNGLEQKGLIRTVQCGTAKIIDFNPRYFFRGKMDIRSQKIKCFDRQQTVSDNEPIKSL